MGCFFFKKGFSQPLFKSSKDLASFQVSMKKIFLVLGFRFFVSDIISGIVLGFFWPTSSGPRPKPLDDSILLKFPLETRLKSETLDTSDDLLMFQVQKL